MQDQYAYDPFSSKALSDFAVEFWKNGQEPEALLIPCSCFVELTRERENLTHRINHCTARLEAWAKLREVLSSHQTRHATLLPELKKLHSTLAQKSVRVYTNSLIQQLERHKVLSMLTNKRKNEIEIVSANIRKEERLLLQLMEEKQHYVDTLYSSCTDDTLPLCGVFLPDLITSLDGGRFDENLCDDVLEQATKDLTRDTLIVVNPDSSQGLCYMPTTDGETEDIFRTLQDQICENFGLNFTSSYELLTLKRYLPFVVSRSNISNFTSQVAKMSCGSRLDYHAVSIRPSHNTSLIIRPYMDHVNGSGQPSFFLEVSTAQLYVCTPLGFSMETSEDWERLQDEKVNELVIGEAVCTMQVKTGEGSNQIPRVQVGYRSARIATGTTPKLNKLSEMANTLEEQYLIERAKLKQKQHHSQKQKQKQYQTQKQKQKNHSKE